MFISVVQYSDLLKESIDLRLSAIPLEKYFIFIVCGNYVDSMETDTLMEILR